MRGVSFTSFPICAGEFMKGWLIYVHHYGAYSDNASHNIRILNAAVIKLGWRSQQRDSWEKLKRIRPIEVGGWNWKRICKNSYWYLALSVEDYHAAPTDMIIRLFRHLLWLPFDKAKVGISDGANCGHQHKHEMFKPIIKNKPWEYLHTNFDIVATKNRRFRR